MYFAIRRVYYSAREYVLTKTTRNKIETRTKKIYIYITDLNCPQYIKIFEVSRFKNQKEVIKRIAGLKYNRPFNFKSLFMSKKGLFKHKSAKTKCINKCRCSPDISLVIQFYGYQAQQPYTNMSNKRNKRASYVEKTDSSFTNPLKLRHKGS